MASNASITDQSVTPNLQNGLMYFQRRLFAQPGRGNGAAMSGRRLIIYDAARGALAETHRIDEVKEICYKVVAMQSLGSAPSWPVWGNGILRAQLLVAK